MQSLTTYELQVQGSRNSFIPPRHELTSLSPRAYQLIVKSGCNLVSELDGRQLIEMSASGVKTVNEVLEWQKNLLERAGEIDMSWIPQDETEGETIDDRIAESVASDVEESDQVDTAADPIEATFGDI